jgi:hypothetical protein
MSKLIAKLKKACECAPQPMGFFSQQAAAEKPRMQIVVKVDSADSEALPEMLKSADALVLPLTRSNDMQALEKVCQAGSEVPWGGWLAGEGKEIVNQAAKSACDFVIFPAEKTPLNILQKEKMGMLMEIEPSLPESLLRTINELSIDAVVVSWKWEENDISWYHLMVYTRLASGLNKPLLAAVPAAITSDELQALWDIGITGIILTASGKRFVEALARVRQAANELTESDTKKKGKLRVILPRIAAETRAEEEGGGEEEEEDE